MPDIKVNTDAACINTAGSNDVDLDLYGLNVPEEDMPDTGPDSGAVANGASTGPATSGSVTANISGPLDFVRDAIKEYRMQDVFTLEDLMDTGRARIIAAAVFSIAAKNGSIYNTIRPKSEQVPVPRFNINLEAAAAMITSTGDVAVLDFGEAECTNGLYAYSYTGKRAGIWTLAQSASGMGMLYKALAALGVRQHEQDTRTVLRLLTATAERLEVKRSADLLAFANGVLDYSGGTPSFTAYLDKDGDANQTYTSIYGRDAYITSKAGRMNVNCVSGDRRPPERRLYKYILPRVDLLCRTGIGGGYEGFGRKKQGTAGVSLPAAPCFPVHAFMAWDIASLTWSSET